MEKLPDCALSKMGRVSSWRSLLNEIKEDERAGGEPALRLRKIALEFLHYAAELEYLTYSDYVEASKLVSSPSYELPYYLTDISPYYHGFTPHSLNFFNSDTVQGILKSDADEEYKQLALAGLATFAYEMGVLGFSTAAVILKSAALALRNESASSRSSKGARKARKGDELSFFGKENGADVAD